MGKSKKEDVLEQKSPAEFFADNKNIAGFDNVSLQDVCIDYGLCYDAVRN